MSNKIVFLIDNGHGTRAFTKGKCSPDRKIYEGEWNREFALILQKRLEELGIKSVLLVPEEKDVSLSNRVLRANTIAKNFKSNGYDTFLISIHINAAASDDKYHTASGWTVWTYVNGSSNSKKMGQIMSSVSKDMKLTGNRALPPTGYYTSNFYILKNTNMPAVLCENMFMDNKEDEEFLLSDAGKKQLLELYEISILKYIQNYS